MRAGVNSTLRIALIGPPASGKGWGERAVSTLGSKRCNSTLLPHVFYGMGKRSGGRWDRMGWGAYLQQSLSTACLLSEPPSVHQVNIFDQSNFPHWVSTPLLPYRYYRSKCTGTTGTAHMGQATEPLLPPRALVVVLTRPGYRNRVYRVTLTRYGPVPGLVF
jgi:hypothetical protein